MSSGISSKPEQAGHGAPFVSFSTVFNNYFLPNKLDDLMDVSEKEQESCSVLKGDIFLTRTSETIDELGISCVALNDYPNATFSGFVKRLRPTQDDITYDKYMAFYLRSKLFRKTMTNNAVLTLRASLNYQIFSYLNLVLPEHSEQVKIGDLLHLINQKIYLNNCINDRLEGMVKMLYDYWFVQFDFPDKNGKPYKSSGGKMVYNNTLKREIPDGWEDVNIHDLLPIKTGKEDANFATDSGVYPFFTCGENVLHCDTFAFEGKAILLAGNGSFGIKQFDGRFNAYQRTYVLIPINEDLYSVVYCAVRNRIKSLTKGSRGSIVKFITKGDIEDITLVLPSDGHEALFQNLNTLTKKVSVNNTTNQQLAQLRDWLLPMLMNGQVTVT